jgi:predicted metalloprotease
MRRRCCDALDRRSGSENVEDRRGVGGGFPVGTGGIGAIVVVLVGLFLGVDPSTLLALLSGNETQQQTETRRADDGGYGFLAHA